MQPSDFVNLLLDKFQNRVRFISLTYSESIIGFGEREYVIDYWKKINVRETWVEDNVRHVGETNFSKWLEKILKGWTVDTEGEWVHPR